MGQSCSFFLPHQFPTPKTNRFCVDRLKFWKEKWKITCLKRYFFLGKKKIGHLFDMLT